MKTPSHNRQRKAGRRKLGRITWNVRTKPETKAAIIAEAARRQLDHPGAVLERDYTVTENK